MPRFQLDPKETAMENLWRAARMATAVIGRSRKFWNLWGEYQDEAFSRVVLATVEAFLRLKVRGGGYRRYTKDGSKKLTFFDNVLSACYGSASHIINQYMHELKKRNRLDDIEPMKFWLSENDRLPIYVSDQERANRYQPKLERPADRAMAVRKLYDEYVEEFKELGLIGQPLELGPWMVRNGYGYGDDELWLYMESKAERRKLLQGQAKWVFEQKQAERDSLITNKSVLHAQIYNREYKKRKRHDEWKRLSAELEKLYGAPPDGHIWKERRGVVGLYKLPEEDK